VWSVAEHIPDHTGAAYSICETTMAWKMSCKDVAGHAQYTHPVEHAATQQQQHGNVVSGCQLVIHHDAEDVLELELELDASVNPSYPKLSKLSN